MTLLDTTRTRVSTRDRVAVITLHNPPVNTLDRPTRRSLLAALEDAQHDPDVDAVVVTGDTMFSAGADLGEFDRGEALTEPTLHLTITGFLDAMTKPVVAAIRKAALGGGLELALACHVRVSTPDARLGLPETTLGFMPGAGGTQRLPRAVGLQEGVNLILSGRAVDGEEAVTLGLVDDIADDPVARAIERARALIGSPLPRLRDRVIAEPLDDAYLAFVERTGVKDPSWSRGRALAVQAIAATSLPFDEGLALEYRLFTELASTVEARAARYRFAAERAAGREALQGGTARAFDAAGVVGAGTMGRSIALALASSSIPVTLTDASADSQAAALQWIDDELERRVARGALNPDKAAATRARISSASGLDSLAEADLIIEAVYENLTVKIDLLARLDRVAKPGAVLASNTSSLDIDVLAAATSRPESVLGMHFFSPAHVMPLLEVVQGAATAPDVLASAVGLGRTMRKVAVVAQVAPGFIGNRIVDQYIRQAMVLLADGVLPERIDRALRDWGMAMGPFAMLDLVGNDVPWMSRREAGVSGPEWAIADAVAERGWLGRKSGSGWYVYDGKPRPNEDVVRLIAEASPDPRAVSDEEIVERCIYALVNEGARTVSDGTAAKASDVDMVYLNGYGFPAERGGPLFYADTIGADRVVRAMTRLAHETGDPFWTPDALLQHHAADGTRITAEATR